MKFRLIETQLKEVVSSNISKYKGKDVDKKYFDNFISDQNDEESNISSKVLKDFENSDNPFGSTIFDEKDFEVEELENDIFDVTDMLENLGNMFETLPEDEPEEDIELEETFESYNLTEDEIKLIMSDSKKINLAKNLIRLHETIDFSDPKYKDFDPKGELITIGNKKLGKDIMIFNMTTAVHCPSLLNGMCQVLQNSDKSKIACYAYQDEVNYPGAFMLRIRQMKFWQTSNIEEILNLFRSYLNGITKKPTELRFNQSGDIDSVEDIEKLAAIGKMLQEEYDILTYTYTARSDLKEHFKLLKNPNGNDYVIIQGSGFYASDSARIVTPKDFTPSSEKIEGKVFQAFPSKSKLKPADVDENVTYLEDLNEDKYSKKNPNGWFMCPADCSKCHVCKDNRVHNIAVGIHRIYKSRHSEIEGDPVESYKIRERMKTLYSLYSKIVKNIEDLTPEKLDIMKNEFSKDKTFDQKFKFDDILDIIDQKIKNIEQLYMKKKDVKTDTKKMAKYVSSVEKLKRNKKIIQNL